jgi:hypothetical protein
VTAPPSLPYPGLRSFRRDEIHLFFGRDRCIDSLVERLARSRFLAVLGSSGTGKSSLVKTGLLSALEMGLLKGAGSQWRVVDLQPAKPTWSPMRNMAQRLVETSGLDNTPEAIDALTARLKADGPRALLKWCSEDNLPRGTNLLLLVDQFEELFRRDDLAGREEAEAFVSLLLESKHPMEVSDPRLAELPIFVTLTMRSEFLGACSLIPGLTEAINESIYLTPRMTREECREAIVGPARVCGFDLDDRLANRILNDLANFVPWEKDGTPAQTAMLNPQDQLSRVARRADQLPIMQHALNQIWQRAKEENASTATATVRPLTLADYEAVGGVSGALDKHANHIFNSLEESRKPVAEAIFRALTWGTTVAGAVRQPTTFNELIRICGGDEAAARDTIDIFRAPTCNFLQPESSVPLTPETVIDITHESLIRQWSKLGQWVLAEARAADTYRVIESRAKLWKENGDDLLSASALANAIAWRNQPKTNNAWAARYGNSFDLAKEYIDKSEAEDRKRAEDQRRRETRSKRRLLVWATAVSVLFLIGLASPSLLAELKYALNQALLKISGLTNAPPSTPTTAISNNDILKNIVLASNNEPLDIAAVPTNSPAFAKLLAPIDLQALSSFVRQGYPRELLGWLATDTFQLTIPGFGQTLSFRYNPPDDYGCSQADPKHRCYVDWMHIGALTGLTVEEKTVIALNSKPTTFARFCFDPTLAQQTAATVSAADAQAAAADMDIVPTFLFNSPLTCGADVWNPAADAGMPIPNTLGISAAGFTISIVPRSGAGLFGFLGSVLKMQLSKAAPSQYAFIPDTRKYAIETPTLETVHDDPNLLTIVTSSDAQKNHQTCFVSAVVNNASYCVPDEAATTKRVFSLLSELVGIRTSH